MIKIELTQGGRLISTAELFDAPDPKWEFLELMFPDARTITRNNAGWIVDLERN